MYLLTLTAPSIFIFFCSLCYLMYSAFHKLSLKLDPDNKPIKKERKTNYNVKYKNDLQSTFNTFNLDIAVKSVKSNDRFYFFGIEFLNSECLSSLYKKIDDINYRIRDFKIVNFDKKNNRLTCKKTNTTNKIYNLDDTDYKDLKKGNVYLGFDVDERLKHINVKKAPHMLIAGITGSGKSVFLKSVIETLTNQHNTKIEIVDPKKIDFKRFESFDNVELVTDDFNDYFERLCERMDNRYTAFEDNDVDNIDDFNKLKLKDLPKMSNLYVIVDELADIEKSTQDHIKRLVQKARASSIHLILATQRPTKDNINPTIKANCGFVACFKVSNALNSRVVLDEGGGENLAGNGEFIFKENGDFTLIQGLYTR